MKFERENIPSFEKDILKRVHGLEIDYPALSLVSNIFRVANGFRNHAEKRLLGNFGLSFSGFTVLWVLWVWGPQEPARLAHEAGISKATLTGVLKTLESLEFTAREPHRTDGRKIVIRLTNQGKTTFRKLLPRFNSLESAVTADLSEPLKTELTGALRTILRATQEK